VTKRHPPLPTKQQIAEFIKDSGGDVGKREIARAFALTGEGRIYLKTILRELNDEGAIRKGPKRQFADSNALPTVTVIEVFETDKHGDLLARPVSEQDWEIARANPDQELQIRVQKSTRIKPAAGIGDRLLARLEPIRPNIYSARPIRRLSHGTARILGVIEAAGEGFILTATDRKNSHDYRIRAEDLKGAKEGDLVTAEVLPSRGANRYGPKQARVAERLGNRTDPKAFSLIALHTHEIPYVFPSEAIDQANHAKPVTELGKRTDLRKVPLVTIDGEDARDFDDAVFAEPDTDPNNPNGWHLIVAIADVANYVRPGDALDKSALARGNSVYFPDQVVPMLPEALSNNLCSLRPNEDRPTLVAHMWIDADGEKIRHRFERALIRSAARLTYTQAQLAHEGRTDEDTAPIIDTVIKPLFRAYEALTKARLSRGTLDLDIPEKKIVVNDKGQVTGVSIRERFDSHKLIEEFMILANVSAAEALEEKLQPTMYRVHDEPSLEKLEVLRTVLGTVDIKLAKGQILRPKQFMQILEKAESLPQREMIHQMVLRTQSQAKYSPDNLGHFGLALRRYAHFTSPIRRYADLEVHRALISGYKLGNDGLLPDAVQKFTDVAEHISSVERRAAKAEREVVDRYACLYLQDRVGATFAGRIGGVTHFGLFVTLSETGVDGLIPISTLPNDFYRHDETHNRLIGSRTGQTYTMGDPVQVRLLEASPLTGSLSLAIDEGDDAPLPKLGAKHQHQHRRRPNLAKTVAKPKGNIKANPVKKAKKRPSKGKRKHQRQSSGAKP